ncbi:MAG: biotin-dependent carboxyltransferase family protein [Solirubrobacterales bacterium]|nr:biotin-dependent carboxyltransferase family protein [Solirubrobacterales bacterium]
MPTTNDCWRYSIPIKVIKPGLATSVQDLGRRGYYHVGVPPSGALDQFSLLAANLLVGNSSDAAALECAYMGPELHFTESTVVAATGADIELQINGQAQPAWTSVVVAPGDVVTFGYLKRGARMCLAVAGGIDVPEVLGSRSTYTLGALGGHEGRVLQAGDELAIGPVRGKVATRTVPLALRPDLPSELEIRVVMGLYDHLLTDLGRQTFLATSWTLTPVADRVGFRYKGAQLDMVEREQPFGAGSDPSNIVDAPYPIGSIQIPGAVEPIVLHRDAVSGGGYAMIATVISADMDAIAQSAPGSTTRFVAVDLYAALAARAERAERISRLRGHFG